MDGNVITPPKYLSQKLNDKRIIFLAGPIQGSSDWHSDAVKQIHSLDSELYIASPRRTEEDAKDFTHEKYLEQVAWERYYLERAWRTGVVMFWLAKESNHLCDRAYAQTTRFELGESKVRHEVNWSKLVIGIEKGFTGEKYIRNIFTSEEKCRDVRLFGNLKETCGEAVRLIKE